MASARATLPAIFTCAVMTWAGCGDDGTNKDMTPNPPPGDMAMAMVSCSAGQTMCADGCRDLMKDPTSCGKCAMACAPGFACEMGTCQLVCGGGTTRCDQECKDLSSDPVNCGGCKKQCAQGAFCVKGMCAPVCMAGQTLCVDTCTHLMSDNKHCGDCTTQCAGDTVCDAGKCVCRAPKVNCANACVDTQGDNAHCGGCGMACTAGFACVAGKCIACGQGQKVCPGVVGCANLLSDNANCGDCGKTCAGGAACKAGVCACPPNQVVCNGNCLDVRYDPSNCAMCNKLCLPGQACNNGICEIPKCVPTGQRIAFGANVNNLTGCQKGNPCQGDMFVFDAAHQASFQSFNDSITCPFANNVTACISNVGVTTYNLPNICQGKWDVHCDGVVVGTVNTLNSACVGSAMGNSCRVTFAPRPCAVIKLVAAQDGDNSPGCCGGAQPDSVLTAISAW